MSERTEIRLRQMRIDEQIAKLQAERDELEVAIRVLDRFSRSSEKPPDKPPPTDRSVPLLPPRPEGIPSTFEMVETILRDAEKEGTEALTSRELMDKIRERYWPGVRNKQILPSIFGFAPKRLTREGDKWKRKKATSSSLF